MPPSLEMDSTRLLALVDRLQVVNLSLHRQLEAAETICSRCAGTVQGDVRRDVNLFVYYPVLQYRRFAIIYVWSRRDC